MIKVARTVGGALPLVAAVALLAALPGDRSAGAATVEGVSAAPCRAFGAMATRPARLEDFRHDGWDKGHLRKREWHRDWDNRLDFWDPGSGRKVFVAGMHSQGICGIV